MLSEIEVGDEALRIPWHSAPLRWEQGDAAPDALPPALEKLPLLIKSHGFENLGSPVKFSAPGSAIGKLKCEARV